MTSVPRSPSVPQAFPGNGIDPRSPVPLPIWERGKGNGSEGFTTPRRSPAPSQPVLWWQLITEAEAIRESRGLGLASVWAHIHRSDYDQARAALDNVRRRLDGMAPIRACIGCGKPATWQPSLCPSCWTERQEHRRAKALLRAAAFAARQNPCTCDTGSCTRCRVYSDERTARP